MNLWISRDLALITHDATYVVNSSLISALVSGSSGLGSSSGQCTALFLTATLFTQVNN